MQVFEYVLQVLRGGHDQDVTGVTVTQLLGSYPSEHGELHERFAIEHLADVVYYGSTPDQRREPSLELLANRK